MGKKAAPDWSTFSDRKIGKRRWRLGDSGFLLDEPSSKLLKHGRALPLELKPLYVLMALLRRPQALVTKEELIQSIWNDRPGAEVVLAKSIGKLRGAMDDTEQLIIQTVHGRGYRLNLVPQAVDGLSPSATTST